MQTIDLNLRHLRAFAEVAKCGNITVASAKVHLSQPAITQAIAKLERMLGHSLFDRRNAGLFLTQPGSILHDRVNRALDHLKRGVRRSQTRANQKAKSYDTLVTSSQLRALLSVSEAGNYSLAAKYSGLSQPSIYRSSHELERIASTPFFEKTPQGINLSPAAQELADHTHLMFYELRQAQEDLRNLTGFDGGHVTIGTMPLARSYMLPNAINRLLEERPKANVRVVDGPYLDLLKGLRLGHLDMLIGALRDDLPVRDVTQTLLFSDPLAIFARAEHPLCSRKNISAKEMSEYSWVVPRKDTPTRSYFDNMMAKVTDLDDIHVIETSSLVLIRGLLTGSDRLTISSSHQMMREEKLGLLKRLDFDLSGMVRHIGLSALSDWHPTKTQKCMWDLLQDEGSKPSSRKYELLLK